jgi:hypothetical protein
MCKFTKYLLAIGLVLSLSACGGGGDSPKQTSAEGFWNGTTSTGYTGNVVVLENGETWGFYSSGSVLYGALYGTTTTSGNTLTGSGADFNLATRVVTQGSYTGTFKEQSTISLTTSLGTAFNGVYGTTYSTPASLTTLAGTFTGQALTGKTAPQTSTVTITSSGQLKIPATLGCATSGTVAPRSSGKNIFDLNVTFTGSTCALGNGGTAKGVLYYDAAIKQILAMGMNTGKTDGFIAFGVKP